jgi:hypothetical protein
MKRAHNLIINTNLVSIKSLEIIKRVLEAEYEHTRDTKHKLVLLLLITNLKVEIKARG